MKGCSALTGVTHGSLILQRPLRRAWLRLALTYWRSERTSALHAAQLHLGNTDPRALMWFADCMARSLRADLRIGLIAFELAHG